MLVRLEPDASNGWPAEDIVRRWVVANESRNQPISARDWLGSKRSIGPEAKLPWSQQEHLARPAATVALPTADRHRSHPLAGVEKDATLDEATHRGCEKIGTGTFAIANFPRFSRFSLGASPIFHSRTAPRWLKN